MTAFSVICNKSFYKVYTLLSHTPHHTKSPLGCRGRDTESRRSESVQYFLTVDRQKKRVCKEFFLATICETADKVRYHVKHKRLHGGGTEQDRRGKYSRALRHRMVLLEDKDYVRKHIKSYPAVDSHYCRSRSRRKYLPEGLSVAQMYRKYKLQCAADNVCPQKEHVYRSIFCADFNFGFHVPKKDQCRVCNEYKLDESNTTYVEHLHRKEQARQLKSSDKEHANNDPSHCTATFDSHKVLCCPSGKVGTIYYKRKLATYNLTVFELNTKYGYCYMWDETVVKRGSCEIGSCLWKWFQCLPENIKA